MSRTRRVAALSVPVAAAAMSLLCIMPAAGAQTVPPDLAGERFGMPTDAWESAPAALVTTTRVCDHSGGVLSLAATGLATGPYPGTYEEKATVTLGAPDGGGLRPVLSVEATFAIDSPGAQVSGTKHYDPSIDSLWEMEIALCHDTIDAWFTNFAQVISPQLAYTAFITTAAGTYVDRGAASLSYFTYLVTQGEDAGTTRDHFEERFRSDGLPPELASPTTVGQCKDGGWKRYGFKNQGDCVSFVASGGRSG